MKTIHPIWLAIGLTVMNGPDGQAADSNSGASQKENQRKTQVITIRGAKEVKITAKGEIWIGGGKEGDLTDDGEIWVAGVKEGELTKDGEVWKGGENVGEITSKGDVWKEGDQVGTVEKDGTIWIGSSREGSFKGGRRETAAAIVFFGFFDLKE